MVGQADRMVIIMIPAYILASAVSAANVPQIRRNAKKMTNLDILISTHQQKQNQFDEKLLDGDCRGKHMKGQETSHV